MSDKPRGNPNIAKLGEKYRFGSEGGNDPAEAGSLPKQSQYCVRAAIRVAAGKRIIDPANPKMDIKSFPELFGYKKGDPLSPAQVIAVRKIASAMNGSLQAMQQVEDSIAGKATQSVVQTTMTYEQLLAQMSPDE